MGCVDIYPMCRGREGTGGEDSLPGTYHMSPAKVNEETGKKRPSCRE